MSERDTLEQAIVALELQRAILGDTVVDAALAGLRQNLVELERPGPTGQADLSRLSGERKLVTVMFADLSGFTALSEKLDPEHVRSLMNSCFNCLVPLVEQYGGVVDKFIGDEIMALFGAPTAHENDAERALRAALAMMEALAAFNARHATSLEMHIGISTGLVVAGGLGSDGQQRYSVMGDTVNLAARLEDSSEAGQILVGPNTYRLTVPLFDFDTLPPIRVKGKVELIPIFALMRSKTVPGTTRGIAGLHSPIVGRDAEIQRIRAAVKQLSTGRGMILTITGEPGLGKSRLLTEVRQMSGAGARWAEGHAQSYAEGMSYWMVKHLLDNLLGIPPDTPIAETATALQSSLRTLFPEDERFAQVYPYLARLREVPLDSETETQIGHVLPEALQKRMRRAFGDLICALCRLQSVVLVWEDLHWADPSSLGLLEALLPLIEDQPLLLLFVFRPQEGNAQDWYRRVVASRANVSPMIELAPLTDAQSQQLAENLLRIENLPVVTRQLLFSKAEGNPFFLEELLRSLIDAGMVLLEGERAIATRAVEQLQVPDTVQGVVAARIDRLPQECKDTLQTAAVIGRVFQRPLLAYLLERERGCEHLDGCLGDLQRRELIRHHLPLEYIFKHAVTQDVAYNSLLMAKRKELHRATAEAIEVLFPDQLEELSAALAYHYERAESPEKAIDYLTRAADHDRQTYSNAEAIAFYRAALEHATANSEWAQRVPQLYESLGDVLALTGRHEEARQAYQEALTQAPRSDRMRQSRLRRKEGNTWMPPREFEKSLRVYQLAETLLGPWHKGHDLEWQREWLEIQLDQFWARYWANQVQEMMTLVERMRPVVEDCGTAIQRSKFFRSVVMMAWRRDRLLVSDETLGFIKAAVAAARESADLYEIAFATLMLGMSHLWRAELEQAEVHLHNSLKLAEQIGDLERQVLCLTYLTVTYRRQHQIESTRFYAKRSQEAATNGKLPPYISLAKANLAWAAWAEGNLAEAQATARAALEHWVAGLNTMKWLALWPLIGIAVKQEAIAEAIEHARVLVNPPSMRLPQQLERQLQDAIKAWEENQTESTRTLLQECIEQARLTGWL